MRKRRGRGKPKMTVIHPSQPVEGHGEESQNSRRGLLRHLLLLCNQDGY